ARRAGRSVCAPSNSYPGAYRAWNAFHDSGAVTIQFHNSGATPAMASLERTCVCDLRVGDWDFRPSDEFPDAGHRRRESGCGDYFVWLVLFICGVQGVLAHPPSRDRAAPWVDDSGLLDWACRGNDTAARGNIFCDESSYRFDAAGILRNRILDRICSAFDCG